jgi:hypothetical protein
VIGSVFLLLGIVVGLFGALLAGVEVGYRRGRRRALHDPQGAHAGTGAVEGAIFGLLGLLLAFTFAGAASRFDTRRALAVEEANDIGTAWLRLDLLPAEDQSGLQDLFRRYVDTRIAVYDKMPDIESARLELARGNDLQGQIWSRSSEACRRSGSQEASLLLLPALNAMIDITTTRTQAALAHVPTLIIGAEVLVALLASVLVGHAMSAAGRRNLLHAMLFAAAVTLTVYVILDFEYPRVGLIRLDPSDQALLDLRQSLGAPGPLRRNVGVDREVDSGAPR